MNDPMTTAEFAPHEQRFMARALELAQLGLYSCDPNPRVGCVIAKDDRVIGEGWHQQAGEAHAEINALRNCEESPKGATAYVTLEPCAHHGRTAPCANALIEAGVARVVAAIEDPDPRVKGNGLKLLEDAGISTSNGLLASAAQALNPGFFQRHTMNRPWVRLKIAASLDGATALANGASQWITDEAAREDVHCLRARSSAVVTGSGTVIADNPRMNVRLGNATPARQPLPVVLDSKLRCTSAARIFSSPALVFTCADVSSLHHPTIEYEQVAPSQGDPEAKPDLHEVLVRLAARDMNEVLVEAGPTLSGSFLRSGLVDELVVYQAPKLMGAQARGMLDLGVIEAMDNVIDLQLLNSRRVGTCQKLTYRIAS